MLEIRGNLALQDPSGNQDLQVDQDGGVTWVLLGKKGGRG